MSKLKLENVSSPRGAPMGRLNRLPEDRSIHGTLQVARLRMVDGDYDSGGAYWGGVRGSHIYCAHGDLGEVSARVFVRAHHASAAKWKVKEVLSEHITFEKGVQLV